MTVGHDPEYLVDNIIKEMQMVKCADMLALLEYFIDYLRRLWCGGLVPLSIGLFAAEIALYFAPGFFVKVRDLEEEVDRVEHYEEV